MELKEISNEQILAIAEKLKNHITKYQDKVALYISKNREWKQYTDKECTSGVVKNISRGYVSSQLHRRLFVQAANELLKGVVTQQNQAAVLAERIS